MFETPDSFIADYEHKLSIDEIKNVPCLEYMRKIFFSDYPGRIESENFSKCDKFGYIYRYTAVIEDTFSPDAYSPKIKIVTRRIRMAWSKDGTEYFAATMPFEDCDYGDRISNA